MKNWFARKEKRPKIVRSLASLARDGVFRPSNFFSLARFASPKTERTQSATPLMSVAVMLPTSRQSGSISMKLCQPSSDPPVYRLVPSWIAMRPSAMVSSVIILGFLASCEPAVNSCE